MSYIMTVCMAIFHCDFVSYTHNSIMGNSIRHVLRGMETWTLKEFVRKVVVALITD